MNVSEQFQLKKMGHTVLKKPNKAVFKVDK